MFKKRLLRLATFLRQLPRKKFNLSTWTKNAEPTGHGFNCNTVACALGWACSIPYFRSLGLTLEEDGDTNRNPVFTDPKGDTWYGFSAATEFFGIDYGQAKHLFAPALNYTTPKQVARRIEQLVAAASVS